MNHKKRIFIVLALLITTSLACQAVAPIIETIDYLVTSPTQSAGEQSTQLEIFEDLWQIVNEEYLYPDFNGVDWDAKHTEYKTKIEAGLTAADFYATMDEMIYSLGDDHSVYLSPEDAAYEDSLYAGNYDYVGIGVYLLAVPERDRAVILQTFANSPADQAGLKARDNILLINGQPILDQDGYISEALNGPAGSQVNLTVQTPGQMPREITVERQQITGGVLVPNNILTGINGEKYGYVVFTSFSDGTLGQQFGEILTGFDGAAAGDTIAGLIIDNRFNEGGADTVLSAVLSYLTEGTVGYFVNRNGRETFEIKADRKIKYAQEIPLVVLVGVETYSFGEVFTGILQDLGRAYIIGEVSGGNIETLWGYDFDDGSRAWIAHDTFRPFNHPDMDWEITGIIPDQIIPVNWDEYLPQTDPAVIAAMEYFTSH